jgi:hypothetical protein
VQSKGRRNRGARSFWSLSRARRNWTSFALLLRRLRFSTLEFSISTPSLRRLAMTFPCSKLAYSILGFSLTAFAAGSLGASAQETAGGSAMGGACSNDNAAAFADPLNKPHWNGWGVDPLQRRFQPADMARLSASDVTRLKLKWAFGFPGASRAVAQATVSAGACLSAAKMEKSMRSIRRADARTGRSTQAKASARPWS